ncbi:MAG: DegT/DnrJ/EryC1/StrS family aminotransferase [Candidatus Krumholzibacteria bacterium]|nr:DegT/DnrJ/EryC1/StrS family aminotransferase [Candidatus Krumholzibacteria bacterium]
MSKKIPFIDLQTSTRKIRKEIDEAVGRVLDSSAFILGPELEAFESEFAKYCGASCCAGVHTGTAALHLALACYRIGPGDEVITVPNTFIATIEAIAMAGAKPVLVDVSAETALIDVEKVRRAITPRTKAVIPVHLFGQTCDMDPLMTLAKEHGFIVIEDSCQAHGSTYKGRRAGSLGHAAGFSFYPSKNLGACGEGGAITTSDSKVLERAKALRHHAQFSRNVHQEMGYNYRLDSIQAAILRVKLRHLDEWNEERRAAAKRYIENLRGTHFWLPIEAAGCRHVYHLFPIGCPNKKAVTKALTDASIGWGEHYPAPAHMQPAFSHLGKGEGSFPVAERLMRESVTLPMFPGLEAQDIDRVCEVLKGVERSA